MSMPLDGRIALVTGAASGIGRATALRLAMDGAAMVGCLDRDLDGARRVVDEIEADGHRATAIGADVTDPDVVGDQLTAFAADHGPVEVLVNNAGVPGGGQFVDVSFEDWQRVLDVHVSGAFHLTKAVLPGMIERGWGRVVNVASEIGLAGEPERPIRHRQGCPDRLHRALAYQVGPDGVLVNAVAPGPVDTPMLRSGTPAEIDAELAATRIGRLLRPDEIAASVAFLVGPGGDVFVGQVLSPNGGTVFGRLTRRCQPCPERDRRMGLPYPSSGPSGPGSAAESAELQGIPLGALLRTIVVRRGEDDYLFVLVPAGRRFDWPRLREHLGVRRLTLPDADEALAATGYVRYTITPFGSSRAWPVILDQSAADLPIVAIGGGAPGVNLHLARPTWSGGSTPTWRRSVLRRAIRPTTRVRLVGRRSAAVSTPRQRVR